MEFLYSTEANMPHAAFLRLPPPLFFFPLSWIANLHLTWWAVGQQAFRSLGKWKRKAEYMEEYQVLNFLS